jgi:uncharacterized membrane protein
MSLMCNMNGQCSATKEMCIHVKMMIIVIVLVFAFMVMALGVVGHWVLQWF